MVVQKEISSFCGMGVDVDLGVGDSELPQVGIGSESFVVRTMCHRYFLVPCGVVLIVVLGLRLFGKRNRSVVGDSGSVLY